MQVKNEIMNNGGSYLSWNKLFKLYFDAEVESSSIHEHAIAQLDADLL